MPWLPALARACARPRIAGRVDGKLVDTSFTIAKDAQLSIVTDKDPAALEVIRHSTAHLLAQAVKQLFPEAQVTIGPVIEDGFFYDFAYSRPFTTEDLAAIEARMTELAKADLPVKRRELPRDEAVQHFLAQGEKYKAEIIASIPAGEPIGLYGQGDWEDLCRGPHVPSTGKLEAFKLMKVAGAYWRGDSRNEMLQRIYGTAWINAEAAGRLPASRSKKPRSATIARSAASWTCSTCRKKPRARCSGIPRAGGSSSA